MEVLRSNLEPPGGGVSVGGLTTYETNGRLTTKTDEMSVSPGSMSGTNNGLFSRISVANLDFFVQNKIGNTVTVHSEYGFWSYLPFIHW